MNRFRIVVVDDDNLVRAGFCALLSGIEHVELVGQANSGEAGLRLINDQLPDILLTDISMTGMSGFDLAREALKVKPNLKILMISMHTGEVYVERALEAGAQGYLPKSASLQELKTAIDVVQSGNQYVSPIVLADSRSSSSKSDSSDVLTPRQSEVLCLIANGYTTRQIANELSVSVKTVETHRSQLKERLNIFDTAGLVRYAIRVGLITVED